MKPEIITNYRCQIGEGPIWHKMEKRLYWVDIPRGEVFRFDPATNTGEIYYKGEEPVTGLTIQEDGSILFFFQKGAVANFKDGNLNIIIDHIPGMSGSGLNDMIADPKGRVLWGSIPKDLFSGKRTCGLHRIDTDGSTSLVEEGIGVSNGLGFSPGGKHLYYTDTMVRTIYRYDYDQESGALSNRKVFVEIQEEDGDPDGMTVDAEGYVWSALWGSNSVVRFDPLGKEDRRVRLPAMKISCVCFGGDDYEDMYVTSAIAGPMGQDDSEAAGALFRVRAGIRGVPEYFSRIGL
ncbi:MAG: SMP-30/gluconolactonase/LRE family protein [Deltaproteobacteria bacterium]|nr:SMP-30/gluconolactonase/LRE family protein [Deltaproteobacteria bacterium]